MNDSGKWSMNDWWYCSWLLCIYGCVFFPLLSTAFTVMRICVFSADWWYYSWLSCIFVCFLTIDDIALDFYADLPKVQLRQMQGHGPYLSCSTFNTSKKKGKGKCILIFELVATRLYASIGLSCTVLVALLIRRHTQDERSESLRLLQTWSPLWCRWNQPYFTIFGNWPHICRSTLECPHTFSNNLYFLSTTTLDADCSSTQLFFTINSIFSSQLLFSAQCFLATPFCNIKS